MSFFHLIQVEHKKIRRSRILLLLLIAAIVLWLPAIFNIDLSFDTRATGIAPEDNFFIQGFLGFSWFLFPAGMVVATVLIRQLERGNKGILKMLALPINPALLSLAKFAVLLFIAAIFILFAVIIYYVAAGYGTMVNDYHLLLSPTFVFKVAAVFFLVSIPMLSFFWLLSVCMQTMIFSAGISLVSVIPSILIMNSDYWFIYPMCYPFFVVTAKYGQLAAHLSTTPISYLPWIPVAVGFAVICLAFSCLFFGKAERR
ncbi:ABC transporter permease [Gracilibacillus alcaliphilus]|uniref:ABC transporter permease n=1 Tax=Gracilibacillus alcaliphilus TaxID=1401441 RepID=UPI00195C513C|nr:ABC transporter permease [Gracilibacillus alcaliphilus]MBM7675277.1 hypothetical protein [Gracilibacillus alcaliphilus]